MKSLISLSILSVCFVACQPSKAPEQKQTALAGLQQQVADVQTVLNALKADRYVD